MLQPHHHTITLNVDGQDLTVPLQVFVGALFQSLSQAQQHFVLHFCQEAIAASQQPQIMLPGNGLKH